ncbi:MAG: amidohydrolase family protein, partial [Candidatus Aminicenantaceae bacterium]
MKNINGIFLVAMIGLGMVFISCGKPRPADLVFQRGKVVTVDENFTTQEAVAVRGDKIVFVGSNEKVQDFIYPNTTVIDCDGKLVLPGLIDAHAHLHSLGKELTSLNVTGTKSFEEVIDSVAKKAKTVKPGEWIVGGRWDQNDWEDASFPIHDPLSAVSPDNPVFLMRVDGNAAFANAKALEVVGIAKDTPEPFGGVIVRKENGEPTGVLVNRAMDSVIAAIPEDTEEQFREKFLKAVNACLRVGLTGVHEAGVGPRAIDMYKDLIDARQLKLRVYAMLGEETNLPQDIDLVEYFKAHRIDEYGDFMLSVRSIKLFFDGALGSRGAAFFEPYTDDPSNSGLLRIP